MKTLILALGLALSSLSFAQTLTNYNGDYKLKLALNACNPTARVDIRNGAISIINQDLRDNRGWATVTLKPGTTPTSRVSVNKTTVIDETFTYRNNREVGYTKDTYSFSEKNGKKSLDISLSVETRGNVSGYGITCIYEKI